ncbi:MULTISPECIES: hypothetical protein [Streptomyces]|uniref:Uncharacterized protein n=1 Tax=Streptomyces flaveolus TaxID=67297 RepID=A0ABV3AP62_9ACTN|nr:MULTISPECIES: hypothetical protein [Streptomyces]
MRLDVLSVSNLLAYDTPRAGWEPELLVRSSVTADRISIAVGPAGCACC